MRKHRPSISLAEFAKQKGLNAERLEDLIAEDDSIQSQYFRGETSFYHIADLHRWFKRNVHATE